MIRNYLKIAFRTLWKNKHLSFINIVGLASGMACSLLILLFVQDELRYDRHHTDADRIHRVVKDFVNDDGSRIPDATSPAALAPAMQREIPEVETVTRLFPSWGGRRIVQYGDKKISESDIAMVDSSFFQVFTVPFIKGDPATALTDANAIILTQRAATRYFGNDDPIGKSMKFGDDDVTVTAVVENVPPQAHFHYDFLLSFRRLGKALETNWGQYNYYTYVKVRPGTNLAAFDKKVQGVYERNQEERYSAFYTQPLAAIHLTSRLKWELEPNGDKMYVYIFLFIGVFILLIAAINYINLATAKSSLRAKETGIRKVSGAQRSSLTFQFLLESVLICLIASLIAIGMASALNPLVNELTQKQLNVMGDLNTILYLELVSVFVGLVAGIFPALYLSSFKPVAVLKGLRINERGALGLRKILVVVQFTISITLIIGALIIAQQMDYLRTAKLGFDRDHVLTIRGGNLSRAERNVFLNSVKALPGVKNAATAGNVLGQGFSTSRIHAKGSQQEQQLNFTSVGYNYFDVMGLQMLEGRGFSPEFAADSMQNGTRDALDQTIGSIVINERAVKEFGIGPDAVGKQFVWGTDGDTTYYITVIGVVKDFHFTSMRNEIKPFGFMMFDGFQNTFAVKLAGADVPALLASMEHTWKQLFPDVPFEYTFLDETYNQMYTSEARFQKIFIILVTLGIVIACLGLFALATFSAEQRVKEIGIRKVLGASVAHLVALLSKDFMKLVLVAVLASVPIAIYAMQAWLEGFAYHVPLRWWIFVVAAVIAVLIAFVTISFQAVKAAMADPAQSLRAE